VRRVIPLDVGGAFHTPLMAAAADAFVADLAAAPFVDTAVPVVANTDARSYRDGDGWRSRLADQLVSPVRWSQTMATLTEAGADSFVEVGPGTTLTGLAKRAVPQVSLRNVAVPSDVPLLSEVR
jgi:[acyl-carrier-protein] S-malonyltransferase